MERTYTKVVSRKILLAFVILVIILVVAAVFVRGSISQKLERMATKSQNFGQEPYQLQDALLLIHEAEDDFQESLLSADSLRSVSYKYRLTKAFNEIDTLLKLQADTTELTGIQINKLEYWRRKKLLLSGRLFTLKHSFDSLLTIYAGFNMAVQTASGNHNSGMQHFTGNIQQHSADTSRKMMAVKKKGLLGRIKYAIINKNNNPSGLIVINENHTKQVIDSVTRTIAEKDRTAYAHKLKELQQHNVQLLSVQKELVSLNVRISNELENIINEIKDIQYKQAAEFKEMAFKSYRETTGLLNRVYLFTLLALLVFSLLLLLFILKLDKSEILLRNEHHRSVALAQQKMDLLLHMSHEIRNPLTSIKGFLHILGQSGLTRRQAEMLSSINLSSEMLLRTLNDTLDAAKIETGEFTMNYASFNPFLILQEVIESMEFSVSKNKLTLHYQFEGNEDAAVSGDHFRLQQVMVNLLSNAIKYTHAGSITVQANLSGTNGQSRLQVDITDTGMGISLAQQENLFSKYYQTDSAKGKTGTGLGLYICKQLVEMQGGKIWVKSHAGKGSTFSFYIPYKTVINDQTTAERPVEDAYARLKGTTILAVDDNSINLLFLNAMLRKWDINFLQAADGREALEILSKQTVSLVLTDIQMPEINGYQLVAAIKALPAPANRVPVIAISGNFTEADNELLFQKGFSGFITKPFAEAALVRKLIDVISNK